LSPTLNYRKSMRNRSAFARVFAIVCLMTMLSGCDGYRAYRDGNALMAEGNYDEGLSKIEEAVKLEPKNMEYRIGYISSRASLVNSLLTSAEAARRDGNVNSAENTYYQVLKYDPVNAMAKQGLESIAKERHSTQVVMEAEELFKKGGAVNLADALERLRPVLSENPNQNDALKLKARIDEVLAKEKTTKTTLAAAFRKPISLEFRDASLKSIFDLIVKVSGLNFFFDKDIRPDLKATILAKNTSIEDALRLLLITNQLEQKVLNDNSILIYPNTPQKLKDYQTLTLRTFYLANADVKAVSNTIKTILKAKDIVTDERLGIIIMRDTPDVIRMAERLVALQDMADPEVMLEVEVLEIKRSRLLELGVNWPNQLTLAPLTVGSTALTLDKLRSLNSSSIQATVGSVTVNARKEDQDSNILANPRIRVRNKEKAKIMIGDRVPVITTTTTSPGVVAESVSYVDVGLKLEVEPDIYLDQEVAIKVNMEVSNLVREILSKAGTLSYQIGSRNATTVLRLKDGETQILAGLISDEDRSSANKVPGLGNLPLIGRLFGSQKDDTQRSEIILSITPHLIRAIHRSDLSVTEFDSGTESAIGSNSLILGPPGVEVKSETKIPQSGPSTQTRASVAVTPPELSANVPADISVTSPTVTSVPATGAITFAWQGPTQVKEGEQFDAVLQVTSQGTVRSLPLMLGFDPEVLQVISVQEGDFLRQGNAQTIFSKRIDGVQGKIMVAAVRRSANASDRGVNGAGSLVTVSFKAIKTSPATKIQLMSVNPEPQSKPETQLAVPVVQTVNVTQ